MNQPKILMQTCHLLLTVWENALRKRVVHLPLQRGAVLLLQDRHALNDVKICPRSRKKYINLMLRNIKDFYVQKQEEMNDTREDGFQ